MIIGNHKTLNNKLSRVTQCWPKDNTDYIRYSTKY